jgi:hypothetical protein
MSVVGSAYPFVNDKDTHKKSLPSKSGRHIVIIRPIPLPFLFKVGILTFWQDKSKKKFDMHEWLRYFFSGI